MKEGIMMTKNELLLKLHLAAGIGLKGELRLAALLAQLPDNFDLSHLSVERLANFAHLKGAARHRFCVDFTGGTLQQQVQRHQHEAQWVTILDAVYPVQLKEIYQPPSVLFYQGNLQCLQRPLVTFVGARQATDYSRRIINALVPELCKREFGVVSGLAAGADSMAHLAALHAQGSTIAVIGTGLDQVYPRQHQSLQTRIGQVGLVLSEFPLGTPPNRYNFPQRNRILAGLCQALCVTEARHRSGSLITANQALNENRNVLAVPGPVDAPLSVGCNELIQAGAKPLLTVADLLTEIQDFTL